MVQQELAHPDTEQLAAFGLGKLSDDEAAAIESHVAECDTCCETLRSLEDDTFVHLLREAETVAEKQAAADTPPAKTEPDWRDQPTLPPSADSIGSKTETTRIASDDAKPDLPFLPPDLAEHTRYRVQELLGTGGMGSVYKAEHRLMERTVALKVINSRLTTNEAAVERFRREVKAAARLSHPNIVTAFDAEQAGELQLLVMEFVDGTDLSAVIRDRKQLPVNEACDYIRQAALGLQQAHEFGMVHRDIKPQNLMLTRVKSPESRGESESKETPSHHSTSIVKILDFGLAQLAGEAASGGLTAEGSMMGTPDYMAPEQARDARKADIRADIYSLGCTLYALLTGQAPFPQGSAIEKVMAHTEQEPKPMSQFRDDIAPELEAVVKRMMAKLPEQRFQTPAEVTEALSAFADALQPYTGVTSSPAPESREVTTDAAGETSYADRFAVATAVLTTVCAVLAGGGAELFAILLVWVVGLIIGWGFSTWHTDGRLTGRLSRTGWLACGVTALLAGVIYVKTDAGQLKIESFSDDVEVVVTKGGEEYSVIDLKSDSKVRRLRSGEYEIVIKGRTNVELNRIGFTMKRGGEVIVEVTPAGAEIRSFGAEYPRLAPYDAVEWQDSTPRVRVKGTWYELLEIDGTPVAHIVDFCNQTYDDLWQKRFEEDLVQVMSLMGHRPGREVDLKVRSPGTDKTQVLKDVPMTEANRWALWRARGERQVESGTGKIGPIRTFAGTDKPITQDGVTSDDGGWKITATEPRTVRLFEVDKLDAEETRLIYRAKIRSQDLDGKAYLEMWVRAPQAGGEFFSKGLNQTVSGTSEWASYETPFFLQKGQKADLAKLNLVVEGKGTVWIKDVELVKAPLPGAPPDGVEIQPKGFEQVRAGLQATQEWLKLVDAGKYGDAWEACAEFAKKADSKEKLVAIYNSFRPALGKVVERKLLSATYKDSLPGAPKGDYVEIVFMTRFENQPRVIETAYPMLEKDGQWRVSGYQVR